ncbi:MAG: hypothetical protein RLZZ262_2317 [Bacteroidota bacterium]
MNPFLKPIKMGQKKTTPNGGSFFKIIGVYLLHKTDCSYTL